MKVCMVGATGLLGYAGARELLRRGHTVVGIALPPVPPGVREVSGLRFVMGNYLEMSDAELGKCFKGCDGFVFAAGIDERVEGKPPIYNLFKKYNIDTLRRLMDVAAEAGVRKVVVLGSYFAHFNRTRPEMELAKHHPYIRSRVEQEKMVFGYAKRGMDVAVLELPYVFGAQKGRRPVWLFIAEMIRNTKGRSLFYPKGGTAMVTVRQVGECIAGALLRTEGARAYPVGWFNMSWKEWLTKFSADMGMPKRVVSVPTFVFRIAAGFIDRGVKARGLQSGLDMVKFAGLMSSEAYIDRAVMRDELLVRDDDIDGAIAESVAVCMEILDGGEAVGMRAE